MDLLIAFSNRPPNLLKEFQRVAFKPTGKCTPIAPSALGCFDCRDHTTIHRYNATHCHMGLTFMLPPASSYLPDFIDEAEERFLLGKIDDSPWLNDLKRRVQHYGYRYDYKARRVSQELLHRLPARLAGCASQSTLGRTTLPQKTRSGDHQRIPAGSGHRSSCRLRTLLRRYYSLAQSWF